MKIRLWNSRHNDFTWVDVLMRVAFVYGFCENLIVDFEEKSAREFVQWKIAELKDSDWEVLTFYLGLFLLLLVCLDCFLLFLRVLFNQVQKAEVVKEVRSYRRAQVNNEVIFQLWSWHKFELFLNQKLTKVLEVSGKHLLCYFKLVLSYNTLVTVIKHAEFLLDIFDIRQVYLLL